MKGQKAFPKQQSKIISWKELSMKEQIFYKTKSSWINYLN